MRGLLLHRRTGAREQEDINRFGKSEIPRGQPGELFKQEAGSHDYT